MWLSLLGTAFFMGLAGGPHCLAMCAAPCAAVVAPVRQHEGVRAAHRIAIADATPATSNKARWWGFHLGRLMGYSLLGGAAAYAMETVAWFSDRTSVLHPLWVLLHLAALAWGLMLLFQARQPQWVESSGRKLWQKVRVGVRMPAGAWAAGFLWALLPCGLLYSAVMVAALAGGFLQGASSMLAFGVGSGLWLALGPWLWRRVSQLQKWRETLGLRVAGAMLATVSLWALWMDMVQVPAQWCR